MTQIDPLAAHPGEYAWIPPAAAKNLVLAADGYGAPGASLRVVTWVGQGPAVHDKLRVGGTSPKHLAIPLPPGCTAVTVHREDAEDYPVAVAFL